MILEDIKQLKADPRELRKFGLLVGGVLLALGVFFLTRGKVRAPYFLVPGAVLVAAGAVFPKVLKPVYMAWMSLAIVLGFVVSHVILTLFFFLVITPVGFVARCAGKDFLRRKLDPQAATYWIRREPRASHAAAEYERQS